MKKSLPTNNPSKVIGVAFDNANIFVVDMYNFIFLGMAVLVPINEISCQKKASSHKILIVCAVSPVIILDNQCRGDHYFYP